MACENLSRALCEALPMTVRSQTKLCEALPMILRSQTKCFMTRRSTKHRAEAHSCVVCSAASVNRRVDKQSWLFKLRGPGWPLAAESSDGPIKCDTALPMLTPKRSCRDVVAWAPGSKQSQSNPAADGEGVRSPGRTLGSQATSKRGVIFIIGVHAASSE